MQGSRVTKVLTLLSESSAEDCGNALVCSLSTHPTGMQETKLLQPSNLSPVPCSGAVFSR